MSDDGQEESKKLTEGGPDLQFSKRDSETIGDGLTNQDEYSSMKKHCI